MSKKLTKEEFIKKAKSVHGDKYDYSKVNYIDYNTKVCIICPKHGEFWQAPSNHLNKTRPRGCLKCGIETTNNKNTYTTEKFIEKAKKVHGTKYIYSNVDYINSQTKICIICPKHGKFWQTPSSHLSGCGCPHCSNNAKMGNDDFILKASFIHDSKYDYSNVDYTNSQTKVCIICPKHGKFWQTPNNHISKKYGCPKCYSNYSKMEEEIYNFVKELTNDEIIRNDKSIINPYELDLYIPSKKIAIEFNGLYWHSEKKKNDNKYHLTKTIECEKIGIRLIQIFEDEWVHKKEIVKDIIIMAFNKSVKIQARKCELKEITPKICNEFIDNNHIQGRVNSKINIGLFYNNELVSVMSFGNKRINLGAKKKENEYELLRFASKLNTIVIGGANKMLSYFKKQYHPSKIISYCDRRLFNGKTYEIMGFKFSHFSKPNYFYVVDNMRENRFKYRKSILVKQGFDKNKSEHKIMLERGIYRIYDCGCKCFVLSL